MCCSPWDHKEFTQLSDGSEPRPQHPHTPEGLLYSSFSSQDERCPRPSPMAFELLAHRHVAFCQLPLEKD